MGVWWGRGHLKSMAPRLLWMFQLLQLSVGAVRPGSKSVLRTDYRSRLGCVMKHEEPKTKMGPGVWEKVHDQVQTCLCLQRKSENTKLDAFKRSSARRKQPRCPSFNELRSQLLLAGAFFSLCLVVCVCFINTLSFCSSKGYKQQNFIQIRLTWKTMTGKSTSARSCVAMETIQGSYLRSAAVCTCSVSLPEEWDFFFFLIILLMNYFWWIT